MNRIIYMCENDIILYYLKQLSIIITIIIIIIARIKVTQSQNATGALCIYNENLHSPETGIYCSYSCVINKGRFPLPEFTARVHGPS